MPPLFLGFNRHEFRMTTVLLVANLINVALDLSVCIINQSILQYCYK